MTMMMFLLFKQGRRVARNRWGKKMKQERRQTGLRERWPNWTSEKKSVIWPVCSFARWQSKIRAKNKRHH